MLLTWTGTIDANQVTSLVLNDLAQPGSTDLSVPAACYVYESDHNVSDENQKKYVGAITLTRWGMEAPRVALLRGLALHITTPFVRNWRCCPTCAFPHDMMLMDNARHAGGHSLLLVPEAGGRRIAATLNSILLHSQLTTTKESKNRKQGNVKYAIAAF